jgi:NADH-quinone oxidoreductase subunit J
MTFMTVLFYVLSLVLVYSGIRVITASGPVTAVLHLILAFANAAMIWMLLGAEFLALLLVLVYVGAVMVLFLFVVMMLDVRMEELRKGLKTYLPLGLFVGAILVVEMSLVLLAGFGDAGPQADMGKGYNNSHTLGTVMYTEYTFAVEVGAVLLLVGMIAAIALTLRGRRDVKYNDASAAARVKAKDRVRLVDMPSQEAVGANPTSAAPSGEQA